jgi:hypothetical protein
MRRQPRTKAICPAGIARSANRRLYVYDRVTGASASALKLIVALSAN